MSNNQAPRLYDVALSFAGEDRDYVEQVAARLKHSGVRVFYDDYEKVNLWGKDLYVHLDEIYREKAEYTVLFISKQYNAKLWTNHERKAAQERAFRENREYILPARFDDTRIPGLSTTTGYIDLRETPPDELASLIASKVRGVDPGPRRWSTPERVFIMHAASRGEINLDYSVANRRRFSEISAALPLGSDEREYFERDPSLHRVFPSPLFNCWGVPSTARTSFARTQVGDLVLFVGTLSEWAEIKHIGIVRAVCPFPCFDSSRILWPEAEQNRAYPLLFFFDTEVGTRRWSDFCEDIGLPGYNPRGWYKGIASARFASFGGPAGYLQFLRNSCGFTSLSPDHVVDRSFRRPSP